MRWSGWRNLWLRASADEFARKTGAPDGFAPAYRSEWEQFWLHEVCQREERGSAFDVRSLEQARRVWLWMEERFLGVYRCFLRVWPDYGATGIRLIPYPGSRSTGPNLPDYASLGLSKELSGWFADWQDRFRESESWSPSDRFDYAGHEAEGRRLARALKAETGANCYVEQRALVEVLMDGAEFDWRPGIRRIMRGGRP